MYRAVVVAALMGLCCGACATVQKAPADTRLVEAQKAFDEGKRLLKVGQFVQAGPLVERALAIREEVLGKDHPDVAKSLDSLIALYRARGQFAQAEPLAERSLTILEAALGKDHPDVATPLKNLVALYYIQGQFAQAEPLAERSLAILEAALGKDHPDVAVPLNNLVALYHAQGQYARAVPLAERALAIQEAALGKDHSYVADSLNNLGALYEAQGRYERAEPLYERALAIQEAALGKDHLIVSALLNNLAGVYEVQGQYARAEPLYERALAIQEAALGKDQPDVAQSLNNLAFLYLGQAQYARAEPLFERALTIWEAVLGKDHPDVAQTLSNLAFLYRAQGQYERAVPLSERALAILEAALGGGHPDVANSLNNLVALYHAQGQYARAVPLAERALAIQETALGKDHPDVANSLNNLGALYKAQGGYERAEPLYERALALQEAALGKEHPDVATSVNLLADLYRAQGQYGRAEPLYRRARAILEAMLGRNHPASATTLQKLAELHLNQQHLHAALPLLERAFSASEQHLRQEVFGYSEARLAGVLQLLRDDEERLYALVRAHPDNPRVRRLALSSALLRKGRSVEEIADTSRIIYHGLSQADREAFERLRVLRTQLAKLSFAGPGHLAPADYQQRLRALADEGDELEADLARRSAPLRELHALPSPAELLERVATALPKDGVLVEFVAYSDSPIARKLGDARAQRPGTVRYLALLLFSDGRTHTLDLGPTAPVDAAIMRLQEAFTRRASSYQPAAQALYNLTFRPLVPHLVKAKRLFLAPDGQLSLVPFAALHDGKRFLVDRWDITYLTSGKELLRRAEDTPAARSVVVLADPAFGVSPATSDLATRTAAAERSASLERFFSSLRAELANQPWPPLPGTQQEAKAIQHLFPQAQLLLGPDATKDALLKLETPGVLHIATHGFFLEDGSALKSARAVVSASLLDSGPSQRPADPLLRSGLVLAGAAHSGARREDSLVTALELAGLNLWGTQLVVLSACDTGRGDVKLGQGVYGLRRALVVAGAETVVTSLWKVNDETTRELMEAYYQHLLEGQGRTTALREAMKELRKKKPHPYYWAPFIAIGQDAPLRGLTPETPAQPTP